MFSDNTHDRNLESLINEELIKINYWLKINKLSLNVVKSEDKEFNFLGLIIDTNLNWKKHAEKYQMRVLRKLES